MGAPWASPCRLCDCREFTGYGSARFCSRCGHPSSDHQPAAPTAVPNSTGMAATIPSPMTETACDECGCPAYVGPETGKFCMTCGHPRSAHIRPAITGPRQQPTVVASRDPQTPPQRDRAPAAVETVAPTLPRADVAQATCGPSKPRLAPTAPTADSKSGSFAAPVDQPAFRPTHEQTSAMNVASVTCGYEAPSTAHLRALDRMSTSNPTWLLAALAALAFVVGIGGGVELARLLL